MALAKDTSARRLVSIAERAATEGELYGPAFGQENVTISDGFAVSNVTLLSLSRAFYVESVTLSSNRLALMQVTLGSNPTQSLLQVVNRVMVGAGASVTVPIRQVFRPHQTTSPALNTNLGTVTVRKALDTTLTGAHVYATLNGYAIYDDFDFAADKIMLVIGDSILNGTAGITQKSASMEWKTRGYFQAKGVRLR
jgi:hypothetical protein